jgi:hypothetical protein
MFGEALQANYIEALLEEKYVTPMSQHATLLLNISWVVVVEVIFFVWPTRLPGSSWKVSDSRLS